MLTTLLGGMFVLLSGLGMVGWIMYCYFKDKPMSVCLITLSLYFVGIYGIVHLM